MEYSRIIYVPTKWGLKSPKRENGEAGEIAGRIVYTGARFGSSALPNENHGTSSVRQKTEGNHHAQKIPMIGGTQCR